MKKRVTVKISMVLILIVALFFAAIIIGLILLIKREKLDRFKYFIVEFP